MKYRFFIIQLLAFGLVITTCGDNKTSNPPVTTADWTILVYANGNIISENGFTVKSIQNLEEVGSTDKVQVIAMVTSQQSEYNANYYHIEHFPNEIGSNISSPILEEKGVADMSDSRSLSDFLDYGIENYPASHYALVISGYARGWQSVCMDQRWGTGDGMRLGVFANALEQTISEKGIGKFDLIFFNEPLMAMAEVAYEMRNSADYVVGSEFNGLIHNLPCGNVWLDSLENNSLMESNELALNIADAVYHTALDFNITRQISVIDISKIGHLVSSVNKFGNELLTANGINWNEVFSVWTTAYGVSNAEYPYIDLKSFAYELEQQPDLQNIPTLMEAADSVISAVDYAVMISETTLPGIYPGGTTIYMPYQRTEYDSTNYALIDFQNSGWNSVISRFIGSLEDNPGYALTVSVDPPGAGHSEVEPFKDHYLSGDTVSLTASATGNYRFVHWLIDGDLYPEKHVQIVFNDHDIDAVANFELPPSDSTATITGKVYWPGHDMSPYTYVFADTIVAYTPYLVGQARVNLADSNYTMTLENFRVPHQLTFEAQDDANNSGLWGIHDAGDGWWFYDYNGDGIWNDLILVSPGDVISGVDIVLREYTPKR